LHSGGPPSALAASRSSGVALHLEGTEHFMAQIEFSVLDRGFVRLIDHMGSDLSVVNAARVSFGKRKEVFDDADAKLIDYLARHDHTSPSGTRP